MVKADANGVAHCASYDYDTWRRSDGSHTKNGVERNVMRKTELQKTVDRILRALQPFKVEKRQKILNIVSEYISEDLIADDEDDGEDDALSGDDEAPEDDDERSDALSAGSHLVQEKPETDMDISPEERRKRERNERDRERRAAKKSAAEG